MFKSLFKNNYELGIRYNTTVIKLHNNNITFEQMENNYFKIFKFLNITLKSKYVQDTCIYSLSLSLSHCIFLLEKYKKTSPRGTKYHK